MSARTAVGDRARRGRVPALAAVTALVALGLAVPSTARGVEPTAAVHGAGASPAAAAPRAVLAGSAAPTCTLAGTVRTCPLWARVSGAVTWPGVTWKGTPISTTFWSYTSGAADTVGATGPTIVALQGETVHLVVHNALGRRPGHRALAAAGRRPG